jgi:transposase
MAKQEAEETGEESHQRQKSNAVWKEKAQLLESVPGVGYVMSTTLVGFLPELGALDRRKIAALVRVTPLNCDSGIRRGRGAAWGGRAQVRRALYMSVMPGIRYNDQIRSFYQRLQEQGKPAKVALVACMRKLLTILNAVIRNRTPWQLQPAIPRQTT